MSSQLTAKIEIKRAFLKSTIKERDAYSRLMAQELVTDFRKSYFERKISICERKIRELLKEIEKLEEENKGKKFQKILFNGKNYSDYRSD